jgi:triacylglycerol esterase/lipase EstA (alpha/beta hydrolase family)
MRRRSRAGLATATLVALAAMLAVVLPHGTHPAAAAGAEDTPIYFVHGYGYADCTGRWDTAITEFRTWGWTGRMHTVGYYGGDGDAACSDRVATADKNTSINTIGRALADYIYQHHTSHGEAVNLVGHSMGGLIIRAAIDGVAQHRSGYPPKIRVTNAVTINSPHQGVRQTDSWKNCHNTQCDQMRPGSSFLKALHHAPQGAGGTDWSLTGSSQDRTVAWSSGVDLDERAQHKYHYLADQPSGLDSTLTHGAIKLAYSHNREYHLSYWNVGMSQAKHTTNGWSPLWAVYQACLHAKAW